MGTHRCRIRLGRRPGTHRRPAPQSVRQLWGLIVTDRLRTRTGNALAATIDLMRTIDSDNAITSDPEVARSEMLTGHRNSAIAHVLAEHHRLTNGIDKVLAQYFAQCAITATATTVAKAALFLADRDTTTAPLDAAAMRRVNAVLLTSGMYGAAGDIAYRIGLPAKSGIGGGVLAVMPGTGTVCVWSPPLDADGNSAGRRRGHRGVRAAGRLVGFLTTPSPKGDAGHYRTNRLTGSIPGHSCPCRTPCQMIEVTLAGHGSFVARRGLGVA